MLNPLHLRTLAAVIRAGSLAAAARQLGYTSSAVSQQISALERAVKTPLFERGAQNIRPTPVAQCLVDRAAEALAALGTLEQDIVAMAAGTVGRLRLGSFPTASHRLVPAALADYLESHPEVRVELDEGEPGELVELLRTGELDLALVYRYDLVPQRLHPELASSPLLREELVLLLPAEHELAHAERIRLEDLRNARWVASRVGTAGSACLHRSCATAGFEPRIDYRSNDYDVVRELVRSGLGVALMPALAHVPGGDVVARRVEGLTARRHISTLRRSSSTNPTVPSAIVTLQRSAAQLAKDLGAHVEAV